MDVLGIAILIVAIAFAVLVIFLIRSLRSLSHILQGVEKTVAKLPDQMDDILKETESAIHNSNETIVDLNKKMRTLTPLFYILQDIGDSSRHLSSSLVEWTSSFRRKNKEEEKSEEKGKDWRGLYSGIALAYVLMQTRKALKEKKERRIEK